MRADGADLYDLTFPVHGGGNLPLAQYRGRPILVVNTASRCGFTPQLGGMQALWKREAPNGLAIVGVPCNQFGGQEPLEGEAIKAFCATSFGVDFPLTAKLDVKGEHAHPFYRWARAALGPLAVPRWNFWKILVGADGRARDWYSPLTKPEAGRLGRAIARAYGG
ncbi:MAG: glutathione peroxidase [Alphaproteobacteria bacterium]|nr:glutathione peroxidase [Alphaproteobacteria bacterium]